jgi:uncharacterized damage-inducible protein DinB
MLIVSTPLPTDPPGELPEREMLMDFLRFYRAVVVRKVEGLPRELAIQPASPSILSALGVVKHLAWVERGWSRRAVLGEEYPVPWTDEDPDADLRIEDDETVDSLLELYRTECAAADARWSEHELDEAFAHRTLGRVSLRWIIIHMIEETARHAGHLDLISERLDGRTGD